MIKRTASLLILILSLAFHGCIRETYDLNLLSQNAHLYPTIVLSANGDVAFKDLVKPNDTVTFDQNKLVTLIFKKNSVIDMKLADFSKGILKTAVIWPGTIDLGIDDVLDRITGSYQISNPLFKFNYTNSFTDPITIHLNVMGIGKTSNVHLNLTPFTLNIPTQQSISASYIIDKTNSNLAQMVAIPPRLINYSGSAVLDISGNNNLLLSHLVGSLEMDIPLELRMNNLQYCDTIDNFLKDESDNPVNPENFDLLSMKISAKNGFPFAVSMKISTYKSATQAVLKTVNVLKLLEPAPVDASGKATSYTESSPDIELTKDFFKSSGEADKIIFTFTVITTGNGVSDVKINSDYRISFNAALMLKPDVDLNKIDIFKFDL